MWRGASHQGVVRSCCFPCLPMRRFFERSRGLWGSEVALFQNEIIEILMRATCKLSTVNSEEFLWWSFIYICIFSFSAVVYLLRMVLHIACSSRLPSVRIGITDNAELTFVIAECYFFYQIKVSLIILNLIVFAKWFLKHPDHEAFK